MAKWQIETTFDYGILLQETRRYLPCLIPMHRLRPRNAFIIYYFIAEGILKAKNHAKSRNKFLDFCTSDETLFLGFVLSYKTYLTSINVGSYRGYYHYDPFRI